MYASLTVVNGNGSAFSAQLGSVGAIYVAPRAILISETPRLLVALYLQFFYQVCLPIKVCTITLVFLITDKAPNNYPGHQNSGFS